ncbi:MAG: glycosyltransferase [Clostridia bacterium]|nr:glycosyltransferase [Clostridia bacterium]
MNYKYNPKISIVIPAYNASNYLAEAIDSALAQTYPNVEIIVVNDGSKDGGATERIALSYGDKIRYFYKENGGSSSALNMGIANMTGEWFSWLSHDDLYMPDKLEKQIEYMYSLACEKEELSKHIFFSASELIDSQGKIIRACNLKKANQLAATVNSIPHNGYLITEPTVYTFHGCSCLIHKSVFENVGCFDEKLRLLNDIDMWFRIYSAEYKIHYIPEPLVKGRVHTKQVSKSIGYSYHNSEQDMFWNRSLDWLIENYPNKEKLFYLFGRNAYLKTRNKEGDRAFERICTISPQKKPYLFAVSGMYKMKASIWTGLKNMYIRMKV